MTKQEFIMAYVISAVTGSHDKYLFIENLVRQAEKAYKLIMEEIDE